MEQKQKSLRRRKSSLWKPFFVIVMMTGAVSILWLCASPLSQLSQSRSYKKKEVAVQALLSWLASKNSFSSRDADIYLICDDIRGVLKLTGNYGEAALVDASKTHSLRFYADKNSERKRFVVSINSIKTKFGKTSINYDFWISPYGGYSGIATCNLREDHLPVIFENEVVSLMGR